MSCCCCVCVSTGEVGIIEDFGKFDRLARPGMHCLKWPCERLDGKLSLRVKQLEVRTSTKSKDDVTVDVIVAVQYKIINDTIDPVAPETSRMQRGYGSINASAPLEEKLLTGPGSVSSDLERATQRLTDVENHGAWRAYYKLTGVNSQFRAYIEDVVRSEIPRKTLDEVFEVKDEIAHAVRDALQAEMKDYGYQIMNALVTDIIPDSKVQAAMNEINASKRLRLAAVEKAEASKIMKVKDAEAEAEAKYLSGVGVSRQRKAIINGLKESVNEFQGHPHEGGVEGTSSSDVMQLVMMTQYLDTIKDSSAHGNSVIFLPGNPGGLNDMQAQVRQGLLEASFGKAQI